MILITDVDNCFVSCERRRNPELEGKPVIVLSAGEAAVIARSNEAKQLGIAMGEPYFKMKGRFSPGQYIALPADHHYYKQVSDELMAMLREECPDLHQYSIDEAFADMAGVTTDLKKWGAGEHRHCPKQDLGQNSQPLCQTLSRLPPQLHHRHR